MVFGIGEGSVEIITDKQAYTSGEMLGGKVVLKLNQAKKAKGLRIKFYGVIRVEHLAPVSGAHVSAPGRPGYGYGNVGAYRRETREEHVYPQEVSLGGEQDYPAGTSEYPFQLKLPDVTTPPIPQNTGILGQLANAAIAGANPLYNARWFLDASLDLPMSLDINKKTQISFTPATGYSSGAPGMQNRPPGTF